MIDDQVQEKLLIFAWAFCLGLGMLYIGRRLGFFKRIQASIYPKISWKEVVIGFGLYFFAQVLVVSLVLIFASADLAKGWLSVAMLFSAFLGISLAYALLSSEKKRLFWSEASLPWYANLGVGIGSWFIAFPIVLALSQLISLAVWLLFSHATVEQGVVQHLRQTLEDKWLFGLTAFSVFTIVPLTEEYLFRGLLQNYFKSFLHHTPGAIIFSSLVFTAFHYSSSQGLTNLELLPTLFLLSCVLGYVYERQKTLWAPLGLHAFFNLMSLILILQQG